VRKEEIRKWGRDEERNRKEEWGRDEGGKRKEGSGSAMRKERGSKEMGLGLRKKRGRKSWQG
jgi:hypothetical protein